MSVRISNGFATVCVVALFFPYESTGFLHHLPAISSGVSPRFSRLAAVARTRRGAHGESFASWKGASAVRVSTYNVLSSQLCEPEYYTSCDPEILDPDKRLLRVQEKLDEEIAKGAVICLQEVSREWTGPLHQFFCSKGYSMMHVGYGSKKNGYMGVAIAFDTNEYECKDAVLERVSDLKRWPRGPPRTMSTLMRGWFEDQMRKVMGTKRHVNEWVDSEKRHNCHIFTRLQSRKSGFTVCVATYHMPCQFRVPPVMVIHTALAAKRLQTLAGSDPLIWCGDFNFQPGDAPYLLLTEGTLDDGHIHYPQARDYDPWKPIIEEAMVSAYQQFEGQEPAYSNWAQVRDSAPFVGCLDYIFMSKGCRTVEVRPAPMARPEDDAAAVGPFPTTLEPSDHLLLAATVELP